MVPFVDLGPVPVNCSAFARTPDEARAAATTQLRLARCSRCGFAQNTKFDPGLLEYDEGYDNSLGFSPAFASFEQELVGDLADRFGRRGGEVLEIGSGDGQFLSRLCRATDSHGTGFDPSWREGTNVDPQVVIHPRYYDETCVVPDADLICCRHVLEHLSQPTQLLRSLRRAAKPGSRLYLEVPNASHVFSTDDVWDLIYPHFGYFSAPSLRHVAISAGFAVEEVKKGFGGQFLSLHGSAPATGALPDAEEPDETEAALGLSDRFGRRLAERIAAWTERLQQWRSLSLTSALWGAGARAVTFLNVVPGAESVDLVVDSNPRKAGLHVPGTGHPVIPPSDPRLLTADKVIVMNPMYAAEIASRLVSLRSRADVVVV